MALCTGYIIHAEHVPCPQHDLPINDSSFDPKVPCTGTLTHDPHTICPVCDAAKPQPAQVFAQMVDVQVDAVLSAEAKRAEELLTRPTDVFEPKQVEIPIEDVESFDALGTPVPSYVPLSNTFLYVSDRAFDLLEKQGNIDILNKAAETIPTYFRGYFYCSIDCNDMEPESSTPDWQTFLNIHTQQSAEDAVASLTAFIQWWAEHTGMFGHIVHPTVTLTDTDGPRRVVANMNATRKMLDTKCIAAEKELHKLRKKLETAVAEVNEPMPILLYCPKCHNKHIDRGDFATRPHHTHACQSCGLVWRPALLNTVGVEFLPGYKDAE